MQEHIKKLAVDLPRDKKESLLGDYLRLKNLSLNRLNKRSL